MTRLESDKDDFCAIFHLVHSRQIDIMKGPILVNNREVTLSVFGFSSLEKLRYIVASASLLGYLKSRVFKYVEVTKSGTYEISNW